MVAFGTMTIKESQMLILGRTSKVNLAAVLLAEVDYHFNRGSWCSDGSLVNVFLFLPIIYMELVYAWPPTRLLEPINWFRGIRAEQSLTHMNQQWQLRVIQGLTLFAQLSIKEPVVYKTQLNWHWSAYTRSHSGYWAPLYVESLRA